LKLATREGSSVHVELPGGFIASLLGLLGILVSFISWTAVEVVQNSRTIINHDARLDYIETSRFTQDDFMQQSSNFVHIREFSALSQRLDRIENKLDKVLED